MRRAAALAGVLALGIAAPALAAAAGKEGAGSRPNIVFILIDTLRADRLPFHGYSRTTAPFMAALARKSVLFEQAFAAASSTAPSSAALFTSLYPSHNGVVTGQMATRKIREMVDPEISLNRIPQAAVTMGEVMKAAGYATFGISDNYNVSEEMGFAQGFDRFLSNPTYYWGAEEMNRKLEEWSAEIEESEPYFLYIHYIDPHFPYNLREAWYQPPPEDSLGSEGNTPVVELNKRRLSARYDSEIGYLDEHIRRMHQRFGWHRNTILVVTSDHGEEFWDHGDAGHGKTLYDEVLHVPLFVRDTTGRFAPRRVATPVSLVDVLPTLAEMVGQPPVPLAQGVSLLPLLVGTQEGESRYLFARQERHILEDVKVLPESPRDLRSLTPHEVQGDWKTISNRPSEVRLYEHFVTRSVLHGQWKLIVSTRAEASLYRRDEDPDEQADVLSEFPEQAARMAEALHGFLRDEPRLAPDGFRKRLTPEEIERLKSLGYVE